MSLGLTLDSTPEQVASAIIRETQLRRYTRAESVACVSTGKRESLLNPRAISTKGKLSGAGYWFGTFQQNDGYPRRDDANWQVLEFLNRLDAKRTSPGASTDIWLNIFWLQQAPSRPSAAEAYRLGRQAYLTEIKQYTADAEAFYDRFAVVDGLLIPGVEGLYIR